MIDQEQIEKLKRFPREEFWVTTLYLRIDGSRTSKKDYDILLKDMVKDKRAEIEGLRLSDDQMESLEEDFEKILRFVSLELHTKGVRTLVIFSCSKRGLWQVYSLPLSMESRLVISKSPHTLPLEIFLKDHKKFCLISLDREKARIFSIRLGEIEEYSKFSDEVPAQVKEGGWYGLQGKRIERHIEDHLHRHFERVADAALDFFKKQKFDGLILGGRRETLTEFRPHLHAYLRDKIVGEIDLEPNASISEALEKTLELEQEVKQREGKEVVKKLIDSIGSKGVAGLNDILLPLWRGQVDMLVIKDGFSAPGSICEKCGYLSVVDQICPNCRSRLKRLPEIIGPIVETAMKQGCRIKFVLQSRELEDIGGIGAFLRFKI